jgi:hypothetical protein
MVKRGRGSGIEDTLQVLEAGVGLELAARPWGQRSGLPKAGPGEESDDRIVLAGKSHVYQFLGGGAGNYLIAIFKDTPLLSAIGVLELLLTAKNIGSYTFRYIEPMTLVGVFFLVFSLIAAVGVRWVERWLSLSKG